MRFPTISKRCKERGIDITKNPIEYKNNIEYNKNKVSNTK